MKFSVTPGDPGYRRDAQDYTVTLDGKKVPICDLILADDETGIVCTHKRNAGGHLVYCDGDIITVIQRGRVTISVPLRVPQEVPFQ